MNIDVFLHKAHVDIVQMKGAVTTINANMEKIHKILASISDAKLFELMIATSEVWVSFQTLIIILMLVHNYVCTYVCMYKTIIV